MPLDKSCSVEAWRANIAAEMRAGKPRDQAVAIASDTLSEACKAAGKSVPRTDAADSVSVMRYDVGSFRSPVRTPNGYLRCDGHITRVGVFDYKLADGTTRSELRVPDEVFKDDALSSFELVPLTNNHPRERLSPKNTRKYSAGIVQNVHADDALVGAQILITDADAIEAVEAGKTELSCGYVCDLEYAPGVTSGIPGVIDGVRYDAIQRNIVGNHVALVDKGRAGTDASLHLDAADAVQIDTCNPTGPVPGPVGGKPVDTKKIKIDGIEYELPEDAANKLGDAMRALHARCDEVEAQIAKERARADAAEETLAAERKATEEKYSPKALREMVSDRVALETTAAKILKQDDLKLDEMSESDIHKAVVLKMSPGSKDRLDGADEGYLLARYDAAVEAWAEEQKKKPTASDKLKTAATTQGNVRADSAAARKKMMENHYRLGQDPIRQTRHDSNNA